MVRRSGDDAARSGDSEGAEGEQGTERERQSGGSALRRGPWPARAASGSLQIQKVCMRALPLTPTPPPLCVGGQRGA